jgi:hypothetical protein
VRLSKFTEISAFAKRWMNQNKITNSIQSAFHSIIKDYEEIKPDFENNHYFTEKFGKSHVTHLIHAQKGTNAGKYHNAGNLNEITAN